MYNHEQLACLNDTLKIFFWARYQLTILPNISGLETDLYQTLIFGKINF